jgi:uncharacterized protein (TIGR02996 family)
MKGYRETTTSPTSLLAAIEQALVEDPDDLASHAAHADLLVEQGDPRGEFIQVQLALEANLPRAERLRLAKREDELLSRHGLAWLGELEKVDGEWVFARGWLDTLSVLITTEKEDGCLEKLAASPYLGNVRVLRIGEEIDPNFDESLFVREWAAGVEKLLARMPRLEELYLLAHGIGYDRIFAVPTLMNLRVLQLYHGQDYPFDILADNPAFANLTTLLCHPRAENRYANHITIDQLQTLCDSPYLTNLTHLRLRLTQLGDEACAVLVESGMLARLKVLDLRLGSITDEGAAELARCSDLGGLQRLDLSHNALTADGIAWLESTGVNLLADGQHRPDDENWFAIGDIE